jgi:hypothetical protein
MPAAGHDGLGPPPHARAQVNKATLGLLKFVEPYIAFGTPNLKTVRSLIYKRGYGKVRGTCRCWGVAREGAARPCVRGPFCSRSPTWLDDACMLTSSVLTGQQQQDPPH